jgi:hypothetical protein
VAQSGEVRHERAAQKTAAARNHRLHANACHRLTRSIVAGRAHALVGPAQPGRYW